jgi:hypothetical protein
MALARTTALSPAGTSDITGGQPAVSTGQSGVLGTVGSPVRTLGPLVDVSKTLLELFQRVRPGLADAARGLEKAAGRLVVVVIMVVRA